MVDVGSLFGALTGQKIIDVEIRLNPPVKNQNKINPHDPQQQQQQPIVLDHLPSWRLHKNPFWNVKHPDFANNNNNSSIVQQQQQQQFAQQQQYNQQFQQNPNMMMGHQPNPNMMRIPQPDMSMQMQAPYRDVPYAYTVDDDVDGVVIFRWLPGPNNHNKKIEHLGIKVQFIGRIDMSVGIHEGGGVGGGPGNKQHYDFISMSKEIAPPGTLYYQGRNEWIVPFRFRSSLEDKELESYRGRNVAVRYMIKVKMERKFLPPISKEHDIWIQILGREPTVHEPIKMEVGIEDCLHIEFEYERRIYHLNDTITGRIHFLLVRIKIKHMELAVIRRETSGEGVAIAAQAAAGSSSATEENSQSAANRGMPPPPQSSAAAAAAAAAAADNIFTETQTLVRYEIMDGAPVKGEIIPVKLSLTGIPADLTPTYAATNNRFSVKYFLNLVLVDEDDRRYFKQQEIILWRKRYG